MALSCFQMSSKSVTFLRRQHEIYWQASKFLPFLLKLYWLNDCQYFIINQCFAWSHLTANSVVLRLQFKDSFCLDVITGMDVYSLQDILVLKVFRLSMIASVSHEKMTYQTNGTLCSVTFKVLLICQLWSLLYIKFLCQISWCTIQKAKLSMIKVSNVLNG